MQEVRNLSGIVTYLVKSISFPLVIELLDVMSPEYR